MNSATPTGGLPTSNNALSRIFERGERPLPWQNGGNLPWDDPAFSERMLREHLDQSHGAASRPWREIRAQVEQMTPWLALQPGSRLLDVTCGPGLYASLFARAGIVVTGIDFSPASIHYAQKLCVDLPCRFVLGDVRAMEFAGEQFDAAIYLYGQFAVLPPDDARSVLQRIHAALRPGGRLLIELLEYEGYDKADSTWWYTDRGGLWGDFPYLHLGERVWYPEQQVSVERFHILNLESGELNVYTLSDQAYPQGTAEELLRSAGFVQVTAYPAWNGLSLKDSREWVVYVAEKG